MPNRILIVDDEKNITLAFSSLLTDQGYKCDIADTIDAALLKNSQTDFDLVLLDLNLPGESGIDFLKQLENESQAPLVLVISGQSDISTALEAVSLGAIDYLEKPVPPEKLISSVKVAMMLVNANHQQNLSLSDIDENSQIIGQSKAVKQLIKTIRQSAPTDSTVLIEGENGTGKELVATRLYLESKRRGKPFVKVNCPGIPPTLFESELFGHRKGAYTGAIKDYPGKFVMADGGTLFLDEIGDLPFECQAKLLRVLETGEVEPLGSESTVKTDVRILCATNRNLSQMIRESTFREDLYYRISVLSIEVPPLRNRLDDVPLLAGSFLKRYDPASNTKLTPDALAYLTTLDYPGNIRQLKNIIERLTIILNGKTVSINQIRSILSEDIVESGSMENKSLSDKMSQFEKQIIQITLNECDGNISKTAVVLKIDRANLSRKIKELGIKKDEH